jgi:hypothetical protein
MTQMCNNDTVNNVMPPHCILMGKLHEYAKDNPTQLHAGEVALMVQFDGLLATNPREDLLIAVTVGYYTMPIPEATSESFDRTLRFEVVQKESGGEIRKKSTLSTWMLGNFLRRTDHKRRSFQMRRGSLLDVREVQRQQPRERTGELRE